VSPSSGSGEGKPTHHRTRTRSLKFTQKAYPQILDFAFNEFLLS